MFMAYIVDGFMIVYLTPNSQIMYIKHVELFIC